MIGEARIKERFLSSERWNDLWLSEKMSVICTHLEFYPVNTI